MTVVVEVEVELVEVLEVDVLLELDVDEVLELVDMDELVELVEDEVDELENGCERKFSEGVTGQLTLADYLRNASIASRERFWRAPYNQEYVVNQCLQNNGLLENRYDEQEYNME